MGLLRGILRGLRRGEEVYMPHVLVCVVCVSCGHRDSSSPLKLLTSSAVHAEAQHTPQQRQRMKLVITQEMHLCCGVSIFGSRGLSRGGDILLSAPAPKPILSFVRTEDREMQPQRGGGGMARPGRGADVDLEALQDAFMRSAEKPSARVTRSKVRAKNLTSYFF